MVMTVSRRQYETITKAELAVILNGLALVNSERLAIDVANDFVACVKDLRERARTGNLTARETRILRAA